MNPHDEQQLIERAKRHPEDFSRLYRAYFGRVYTYVAYRVASRADAEDLTSDIFAQVMRSLHRFEYRGEGTFAAWLFRIAHNTVCDYRKRKAVHPDIPFDEMQDSLSGEELLEQTVIERERFKRVHTAIQRLSLRRQEIITLRFFAGLYNQEIAQVLGLDQRTVASHLSRALVDLQAQLADEFERHPR